MARQSSGSNWGAYRTPSPQQRKGFWAREALEWNDISMNVRECVEFVAQQFDVAQLYYGHGTDNPWDEAVYLVFTVAGLPFGGNPDVAVMLNDEMRAKIEELARRRIEERRPMAYLLQEAWFAGLPFHVDERVLIPRSPIAELIHNQFEPLLSHAPGRILDLCTGSGCIGIAAAMAFPEARVELSDISPDALELAQRNIRRHCLEPRVTALQSDLFDQLRGPYDLIIANPPYVGAQEVADLPPEYRHEPVAALLSEDEGLALPLAILQQAGGFLSEQGLLVLEVGHSWLLLAERHPEFPVTWLEFEHGGEGVLAISRADLLQMRNAVSDAQ